MCYWWESLATRMNSSFPFYKSRSCWPIAWESPGSPERLWCLNIKVNRNVSHIAFLPKYSVLPEMRLLPFCHVSPWAHLSCLSFEPNSNLSLFLTFLFICIYWLPFPGMCTCVHIYTHTHVHMCKLKSQQFLGSLPTNNLLYLTSDYKFIFGHTSC